MLITSAQNHTNVPALSRVWSQDKMHTQAG